MEMTDSLRNRLVGAGIVTVLAMIFVPMLLNEPKEDGQEISELSIPQKPQNSPSLTATILPDKSNDVVEEVILKPAVEEAKVEQTVAKIAPPVKPKTEEVFLPLEAVKVKPKKVEVKKPAPKPKAVKVDKNHPPKLYDTPKNTKTGGRWFIQVASFSQKQNAVALRNKLRQQGFSANVDSTWSNNKKMYRLRVGPELNRSRATTISNKLNRLNNVRSILVSG